MAANYARGMYKEYEKLLQQHEKLLAEYREERSRLKREAALLESRSAQNEKLKTELKETHAENEALRREILRLNGILNIDGTNSGIPTSRTPLSKKKVIPNSREKSGKTIGGQPGHPRAKLKAFADEEITETETYRPECCPCCGGTAEETGTAIERDELDYELIVRKKRHRFAVCRCADCGQEFHSPIPPHLTAENQYGSHVKALGLSLMNIGNVSVNKTRKMIYGLSEEGIHPTEGWLMKQQKRAAEELRPFEEELRKQVLTLGVVYWDDTVIDMNKKRGCLRFYGDERHALYRAHLHKDKEGLDDDRILKLLPKETAVMHDHNTVNYNREYSFSNIECNVHLLRALQSVTDNLHHSWSARLKKLLETTNEVRNEAMEREETAFQDAYVREFFEEFDHIMALACTEHDEERDGYFEKEEEKLMKRILAYKDNYLAWVVNFSLPFSNNLSERALRGVKSKMKIAGQFQNEESAGSYAAVKSYIETCHRNGINETEALVRLCEGNPYTVEEIFSRQR